MPGDGNDAPTDANAPRALLLAVRAATVASLLLAAFAVFAVASVGAATAGRSWAKPSLRSTRLCS
jgi:hypothetical protein